MTKSTIEALLRTDRLVTKTVLPAVSFCAGLVCGIVAAETDRVTVHSAQVPHATQQAMRGPEDVAPATVPSGRKGGQDAARVASIPVAPQGASIIPISAVYSSSPLAQPLTAVTETQSLADAALLKVLADQRCLADAMYYEARGEGAAGEEAIAEVIFHRTHARGYPHSICGVVYEGASLGHCQFSFACNGETDRPKEPAAWYQTRILAAKIMAGSVPLADVTEGATSFHAIDVQPDWNEHLERTIQIGNHVFYRKPLSTKQS